MVLFVLGSALCGLARSLPTLVVYRAIQGFGAGSLQPTQQAILRQTFPPKEQGMAMAMFAMAIMVGPAVGPTLGGWIVDNYSWPWIFFINIPVGAAAVWLTWSIYRDRESVIFDAAFGALGREHPERIDVRHHLDDAGGFLTEDSIKAFIGREAGAADSYVCGPGPFMAGGNIVTVA